MKRLLIRVTAHDLGQILDMQVRFGGPMDLDTALLVADSLDEIARDLRARIAKQLDEADQR